MTIGLLLTGAKKVFIRCRIFAIALLTWNLLSDPIRRSYGGGKPPVY